jgi:alpha-glucosidase
MVYDAEAGLWRGELNVQMAGVNPYRFRLLTPEGAFYLNALGLTRAEKPESYDFKLVADYQAPLWVRESVFYQIFPDRFAIGNPANRPALGAWSQEGASVTHAAWDDLPRPWQETRNLDFYGGDLEGITGKLDYLRELGIDALYLNPIFVSRSNHRYDIQDFFKVDPHLGGDAALIALRQGLDERGMKLVLDVTPNHLSWKHPWFTLAQDDPHAPTSDFFIFHDEARQVYETWLGVKTLVKLDYRSQKLRDLMYREPDSILRHWLKPPFRMDGWRLDVLNMVARLREHQLQHEVGRELRAAVKAERPDMYLLGEHYFDASPHLQGDQLDAAMNYYGFNIPLRRWLCGVESGAENRWDSPDLDRTLLPTAALAEQMKTYLAALPYVIALQQFNQLDNHDNMRFLSAVGGDKALYRVGLVVLMGFVGVPSLYYGDELGLEGGGDPDNRRTMPWGGGDAELFAFHQRLIALRQALTPLQTGGFQVLHAEGDIFAFQREGVVGRVLIIANRGEAAYAPIPVWLAGVPDGTRFRDALSGRDFMAEGGAVRGRWSAKDAWILVQES